MNSTKVWKFHTGKTNFYLKPWQIGNELTWRDLSAPSQWGKFLASISPPVWCMLTLVFPLCQIGRELYFLRSNLFVCSFVPFSVHSPINYSTRETKITWTSCNQIHIFLPYKLILSELDETTSYNHIRKKCFWKFLCIN